MKIILAYKKQARLILKKMLKLVDKLVVFAMQGLYIIHIRIRGVHDQAYKKFKTYKKYTDNPLTSKLHHVTIWGFIASFAVFTFLQYISPEIFNFATPDKVYAGANTKIWTTLADFFNNNGETATITTENVDANGGNPKLSTTGQAQTETTTAQFNAGTTSGGAVVGADQVILVPTVTIGTQTWAKYNLNVGTMLASGTTEPTNNGIVEKWCFGNNPANCTTYGGLYSWDEMMQYTTTEGAQGICPTGFHLPTDTEYKTLEMYLGMTQAQADATGWRGTDQGTQLKPGGTSGFEGLLSGYRSTNGSFNTLGTVGVFWTSSESGSSAWRRYLNSGNATVNRLTSAKASGFSVRCLKN